MRAPSPRTVSVAAALAAVTFLASGCMASPGPSPEFPSGEGAGEPSIDLSAPTFEFTTVSDPVMDAFTIGVPEGWDSIVYASGQIDVIRQVVSSVSPDGGTVLFLGDPKQPHYFDPGLLAPAAAEYATMHPLIEVAAYVPALAYFEDYTIRKFSGLDGFAITGVAGDDAREMEIVEDFAAEGVYPTEVHAAQVRFRYDGERGEMSGVVLGSTINGGHFWVANSVGLVTDRAVDDYLPMLTAMRDTAHTNPEFTARQQAHYDAQVAELRAMHANNMARIQASAAAHQQKMQAIWAANDASMASYYDRMASMDANQRSFLNYINEEHTVSTPSGQNFQVTTGYDNYYVNPDSGQYVAGAVNFGENDLRAMGLNPNDFEQVSVVR